MAGRNVIGGNAPVKASHMTFKGLEIGDPNDYKES
jgi:hypothetical protein